jgi:protein-S-isoprenylcysteine O-methyltransferase Ste14
MWHKKDVKMKMKTIERGIIVAVVALLFLTCLFLLTRAGYGFGNWTFVILNVIFFSVFLLFIPFRKREARRPASIYLAFIVSLYAQMYGVPLTMYIFMWLFGYERVYSLAFLGSLLMGESLFWPIYMYIIFPISLAIMVIGMLLIVFGWKEIYKSKGELVTTGIYGHIRHPQYLGFLLLTLGMNVQWATLITLLLWPILVILYRRLALIEEKELAEKFGEFYLKYKNNVPMFIPRLRIKNSQ